MRKLRLLFKIIIFIAIFVGAEYLVRYAAYDDTSAISRSMMYELYHQEEGIDVLFSGASHVQLSLDPEVTDKIFEQNTFNAGSSAQSLQATDALIREVAGKYHLSEVFVDLDYSLVMQDKPALEGIYAVSDYMEPSVNKAAFLLHATSEKYYINSFLPLGKGRTLAHSPAKIMEILKKKSAFNYRHHLCGVDSYMGKGYIASYVKLEDGFVQREEGKAIPSKIPQKQLDTLNDIVDFCRDNGISLTFITVPMSDFYLAGAGDYDRYISMIRDFVARKNREISAAETGEGKEGTGQEKQEKQEAEKGEEIVEEGQNRENTTGEIHYYDFNLCRPEMLDLTDIRYYTDDNHLNRDGAALFSNVFARFFTGKIKEEDLFYSSYEEKLENQPFTVYGFKVNDDTAAHKIEALPVTNREDESEAVQVTYCFDGKEETDDPVYKEGAAGTVELIARDTKGDILCTASCAYGNTENTEALTDISDSGSSDAADTADAEESTAFAGKGGKVK